MNFMALGISQKDRTRVTILGDSIIDATFMLKGESIYPNSEGGVKVNGKNIDSPGFNIGGTGNVLDDTIHHGGPDIFYMTLLGDAEPSDLEDLSGLPFPKDDTLFQNPSEVVKYHLDTLKDKYETFSYLALTDDLYVKGVASWGEGNNEKYIYQESTHPSIKIRYKSRHVFEGQTGNLSTVFRLDIDSDPYVLREIPSRNGLVGNQHPLSDFTDIHHMDLETRRQLFDNITHSSVFAVSDYNKGSAKAFTHLVPAKNRTTTKEREQAGLLPYPTIKESLHHILTEGVEDAGHRGDDYLERRVESINFVDNALWTIADVKPRQPGASLYMYTGFDVVKMNEQAFLDTYQHVYIKQSEYSSITEIPINTLAAIMAHVCEKHNFRSLVVTRANKSMPAIVYSVNAGLHHVITDEFTDPSHRDSFKPLDVVGAGDAFMAGLVDAFSNTPKDESMFDEHHNTIRTQEFQRLLIDAVHTAVERASNKVQLSTTFYVGKARHWLGK